jgi:hypothetical protein
MAKAIDTRTTPTPDAQRLRAQALDLAERCGKERDPFLAAQLADDALAAWQQAQRLDGRRT